MVTLNIILFTANIAACIMLKNIEGGLGWGVALMYLLLYERRPK